jgi:hypothetical protein
MYVATNMDDSNNRQVTASKIQFNVNSLERERKVFVASYLLITIQRIFATIKTTIRHQKLLSLDSD